MGLSRRPGPLRPLAVWRLAVAAVSTAAEAKAAFMLPGLGESAETEQTVTASAAPAPARLHVEPVAPSPVTTAGGGTGWGVALAPPSRPRNEIPHWPAAERPAPPVAVTRVAYAGPNRLPPPQ